MPWTPENFASKHNSKLKGAAAKKAADQANALIKKGIDEGEAIRIANKTGDRAMSKSPTSLYKKGK